MQPYPFGHDNERRLAHLTTRELEGRPLTQAERDELKALMDTWKRANGPENNPPADAGMLLWTEAD